MESDNGFAYVGMINGSAAWANVTTDVVIIEGPDAYYRYDGKKTTLHTLHMSLGGAIYNPETSDRSQTLS